MAENTEPFDTEFFKWLREKQLKEQENDKFQPLYITIEQPPNIKKKTLTDSEDEDLPATNNDTRVNFEIESNNTDNCIVYKL